MSFQTDKNLDEKAENPDDSFVQVALPFQIPAPPDLSKVPISVIHSATVETLISQTEDLTARLKVQIRRNAVLERRALELEEKTNATEKELRTLQQQHEVFNEKEAASAEKIHGLQASMDSLKKELELLETRYSEISTLSRKKEEEAAATAVELNAKIKELEKFLPLEGENFRLQDENTLFKGKIEEMCSYLQKKEDELNAIKQQLTNKTEAMTTIEAQMRQVQGQADYNAKAVEDKAELENLLILKEREKDHVTSQINNALMTARQEIKNLQMINRTLQSEKIQAETQVKSCEETINGLSKDNAELEKQIENLQNLWYKLQAEYEKEKIKTTALTKLNRELSVELQRGKTAPSSYEDDFLKRYVAPSKNIEV